MISQRIAPQPEMARPEPDAPDPVNQIDLAEEKLDPLVRALGLAVNRKASLDRADRSGWR